MDALEVSLQPASTPELSSLASCSDGCRPDDTAAWASEVFNQAACSPDRRRPEDTAQLSYVEKKKLHWQRSRQKKRARRRQAILQDDHIPVRDAMIRRHAASVRAIRAEWNVVEVPVCNGGYRGRELPRKAQDPELRLLKAAISAANRKRSPLQILLDRGFSLVEWDGRHAD